MWKTNVVNAGRSPDAGDMANFGIGVQYGPRYSRKLTYTYNMKITRYYITDHFLTVEKQKTNNFA